MTIAALDAEELIVIAFWLNLIGYILTIAITITIGSCTTNSLVKSRGTAENHICSDFLGSQSDEPHQNRASYECQELNKDYPFVAEC